METDKIKVKKGWSTEIFSVPDMHTFFGYYDIQQLDAAENRMLAHVVPLDADTEKDEATVGYFTLADKVFHPITKTRAWCWQQGARLRWHPLDEKKIIVNALEDNQYVAKIVDTETGRTEQIFSAAMYDFDQRFRYGLSLNFSRLQRLRPGYGYNSLPDITLCSNAPTDDGIFLLDLAANKKELIVSLSELARQVDGSFMCQHYINHISIAPDGKNFMFFHIWTRPDAVMWSTRLYVYNIEKKELKLLEEADRVSHYSWKNSKELLVTCYERECRQYYALYDITTGKKEELPEILANDGHPSFFSGENAYISDTYPLQGDLQHLFYYDMLLQKKIEIVSVYAEPTLCGEKRCDLHPRLSRSEKCISFDTTYSEKRRKVVLLRGETL